ncbi:hypothetical protein RS030_142091 [Cryptosporidium xiaoi]|uniref:GATA-type domain-containing protein n=1 Tax=Cryptosporidium xiaoi TaxID=659607 RepID=A0AAV9Y1A9_9CRYT
MSNLNNLALQLAQILNQNSNDGGLQGTIQTFNNESINKLLLEQYNSYLLPYLSRVGNEPLINSVYNQLNIPFEQLLSAYSTSTGFPYNMFLNVDQNNTKKLLSQTTEQKEQPLTKQNAEPNCLNSTIKPNQLLMNLQQNQLPFLGLHPPIDISRTQTTSPPQQIAPLNVFNSNNLNNWAESTLSSLLDKPEMLMNLMRLGAASIMASYYGQCQNPNGANIMNQNSPFFYNMALSPKQMETPSIGNMSPLEASTSSVTFTPIKSSPDATEGNSTAVFSQANSNQQFSDELIFYNFLEQSKKLSCDIKGRNEKKNTSTNKSANSSIRKSCAGRPRLDRSDWCCSLCRCVETAQWRYLRNTLDNNQSNVFHRGKILVCNACYLRVSKENKVRQKINAFQIDRNSKIDES